MATTVKPLIHHSNIAPRGLRETFNGTPRDVNLSVADDDNSSMVAKVKKSRIISSPVVLNLGSIEPQGFGDSVSGVRQ